MNSISRLILGSNSPRRKELLSQAGYSFEVRVGQADETVPRGLDLNDAAGYLSKVKAEGLSDLVRPEQVLLTADTVVLCEGQMLEKASDAGEAMHMLEQLSGKVHKVITGVTMYYNNEYKTLQDITEVWFRRMTRAEMKYYIDTCSPFDKAGAYGIQEWIGLTCIEKINGSFFTVMGLPVHRVYAELSAIGVWPDKFPSSEQQDLLPGKN